MFWGLVVQPNKKYSKTVSTPFHVSQAVLDISSTSGDTDVQLILKSDKVDYILCILRRSGDVQFPLDLTFSEGDEISFRSIGGTVHLTGYLVDDQDFPNLDEGDSSDAEEEAPQLLAVPPKLKRKQQTMKHEQDSSSDNGNSDNNPEEDGSDDDEEEEDDSEDEDVEESADEPPQKMSKHNGVANGVSKKEEKHKESKQKKQQKQQQQQQQQPISKKVQGVKYEDIRVGTGAVAVSGKKVQVYYKGFHLNGKLFDQTMSGRGFEFVLGKGDVIRGWDIGVPGMKVGGKRKISCPPNMAYGQKGSPPEIHPNETLVFEVELRGVR